MRMATFKLKGGGHVSIPPTRVFLAKGSRVGEEGVRLCEVGVSEEAYWDLDVSYEDALGELNAAMAEPIVLGPVGEVWNAGD